MFFFPPRLSGPLDRWFDTSTIVHVKALSVGDICKLYIMQQSTSVATSLRKYTKFGSNNKNIIHHMLINSGWFPTLLKNIFVKLGSCSPIFGMKIKKHLSCHHPGWLFPETTPLKDLFCTLPLRGFAPAGAYNWNEWRDLSHWKNLNYSQVVNHPNISNISKMHQNSAWTCFVHIRDLCEIHWNTMLLHMGNLNINLLERRARKTCSHRRDICWSRIIVRCQVGEAGNIGPNKTGNLTHW